MGRKAKKQTRKACHDAFVQKEQAEEVSRKNKLKRKNNLNALDSALKTLKVAPQTKDEKGDIVMQSSLSEKGSYAVKKVINKKKKDKYLRRKLKKLTGLDQGSMDIC